jgi:hypothetical protein
MTNPKPIAPIQSGFTVANYDIEEQRKRLGKASWSVG